MLHQARDHEVVVERVASHRNGICGEPFHVVLFRQMDSTTMIGIVFEDRGHVAVFDRTLVGQGNVDFFSNSWRGDEFEQALRTAVAEYRRAQELLPVEKWAAGWSPMIDPIPAEVPQGEGNAEKANALLKTVGLLVLKKKNSRP